MLADGASEELDQQLDCVRSSLPQPLEGAFAMGGVLGLFTGVDLKMGLWMGAP